MLSFLLGMFVYVGAIVLFMLGLWVSFNLRYSNRRPGKHWLCRMGCHSIGWTGSHGPDGKLYACERGHGCNVQYLGRE